MTDRHLDEFINIVSSIRDRNNAESFIRTILTPKELEEIPKRVQVMKLLSKGIPQREIAKKLDVSLGTISRGSREFNYSEYQISSTKWWKLIS